VVNQVRLLTFLHALRSGQYKQGYGHLRDGQGGFCCLGVATDIALKSGCDAYDAWNGSIMSFAVRAWFGFPAGNPMLANLGGGRDVPAVTANDDLKWDFNKIADAFWEKYGVKG
jgi:hypothetical protein